MRRSNASLTTFVLAMLVDLVAALFTFGQEPDAKPLPERLGPGDHTLHLVIDQRKRAAIVHVPPGYDPEKPTPVVVVLHGAAMSGHAMVHFCGMNATADKHGFIAVYPSGTGFGPMLTWNAGGFSRELANKVDDVSFISQLLDELERICHVDSKRVYAAGLSNGGMMVYRLAAELSNRIAAIAPVGGTMPDTEPQPQRPVSVIHFHGTRDNLVPYDVGEKNPAKLLRLKSVGQTVQTWVKVDGCPAEPASSENISDEADDLKVVRQTYGPGIDGTEVVLVTVEGGGHTWPGQKPPVKFLGKSALTISANEMIWEFFEKHPMK